MASNDSDEGEAQAKPESPGMMKPILLGAVAVFIAVLGAQVTAPLITAKIAGGHKAAAAQGVEGEEGAEGEINLAAAGPALYTPLDPPFVVSFSDIDGDSRFLQLTLQAMARDERTIAEIKQHAPALRNAFLFLISGYNVEDLQTLEGKEKLRAEMLSSAKSIMQKNTGRPGIEDLFFTSLVIQ